MVLPSGSYSYSCRLLSRVITTYMRVLPTEIRRLRSNPERTLIIEPTRLIPSVRTRPDRWRRGDGHARTCALPESARRDMASIRHRRTCEFAHQQARVGAEADACFARPGRRRAHDPLGDDAVAPAQPSGRWRHDHFSPCPPPPRWRDARIWRTAGSSPGSATHPLSSGRATLVWRPRSYCLRSAGVISACLTRLLRLMLRARDSLAVSAPEAVALNVLPLALAGLVGGFSYRTRRRAERPGA